MVQSTPRNATRGDSPQVSPAPQRKTRNNITAIVDRAVVAVGKMRTPDSHLLRGARRRRPDGAAALAARSVIIHILNDAPRRETFAVVTAVFPLNLQYRGGEIMGRSRRWLLRYTFGFDEGCSFFGMFTP